MKSVASAIPVLTLPREKPERHALPFPIPRLARSELRRRREDLLRKARLPEALRVAQELVDRFPDRESHCRLGVVYRELGRFREALRSLRDALRFEHGPRYLLPEIHLFIAHTWCHLGNTKRMGEALARARRLRPKPRSEAKVVISLGNLHYKKGRFREALEEYREAEKLAPNSGLKVGALLNQGMALHQLGRLDEAVGVLQRAIRSGATGGHAVNLGLARQVLAWAYFRCGRPNLALRMIERAARLCRQAAAIDREAEVLQHGAYIAAESGLWTKALVLTTRSLRLAGRSERWDLLVQSHSVRAIACAAEEDFDQAEDDLARAERHLEGHRHPPSMLYLCKARVRVAASMGEWERVVPLALSAERLALKSGDPSCLMEYRSLRARAEELLGRSRRALYARKAALRVEPLSAGASRLTRGRGDLLGRLAKSSLSCLIVGEGGTEKLDLAREIHRRSDRRRGPSVEVACEHVVFPQSELGGHVRDAWTGGPEATRGRVREAHGGTLILDRVDELAPESQRVLIRMLDGGVLGVGDTREEAVDVRAVATCGDPERLIPGLRERLQGAVLRVAPLRERTEEIPRRIQQLLAGRRLISGDAVAALAGHSWPGNDAEFQSVLESLVVGSERFIGMKLVRRHLKTPDSRRDRVHVYKKRPSRQMAVSLA